MSGDFIEAAVRLALTRRKSHIDWLVECIMESCQSPIEQRMGVALLACKPAILSFPCVINNADRVDGHHGFYIFPQMPIRSYRADFGLFLVHSLGVYRLAVECDGHDFHEKTKEQAAHDKARDRAFLEDDWPLMRFTGSEIYADAPGCADQAGGFMMSALMRAHGLQPGGSA